MNEIEDKQVKTYPTRQVVGLMEKIPQKAAGTRALPPMSLPIPNGDPPAAMRHPSPPDDPPGVRSLLCGFIVKPQIGLLHPKLPNAKPIWNFKGQRMRSETRYMQLTVSF